MRAVPTRAHLLRDDRTDRDGGLVSEAVQRPHFLSLVCMGKVAKIESSRALFYLVLEPVAQRATDKFGTDGPERLAQFLIL